jgi:hypothetical protein
MPNDPSRNDPQSAIRETVIGLGAQALGRAALDILS